MIKNLTTLFAWQAAQYLIPLIVLPYLTRTLGVDQYGTLAIATNIVGYGLVLTDWGFTLTATQKVAQNAENADLLRQVFWDTILAKVLLGLASLLTLVCATLLIAPLREMWTVLFFLSFQIVGNVFTASWFLQGKEKLVAFAAAALVGRALTIPATFLFVHSPTDTYIAAAIQSAATIGTAVLSLVLVTSSTRVWPPELSTRRARSQIVDGWHVFVSQAAVTLYAQSNVVVLGLVAGPAQAGLFNSADRIRRAVQALYAPISTAVFPRINNLISYDRKSALRFMIRLLVIQGAFCFLLSLVLFGFAHLIVELLLGHEFLAATPVVQCMAILPLIVGLSNVLGIQMMLPLGMKRDFSTILATSGLLNISLLLPMSYLFGALGAAITIAVTEACVTLMMAAVLWRRKEHIRADMQAWRSI